jgi:hypothetical protein
MAKLPVHLPCGIANTVMKWRVIFTFPHQTSCAEKLTTVLMRVRQASRVEAKVYGMRAEFF